MASYPGSRGLIIFLFADVFVGANNQTSETRVMTSKICKKIVLQIK